MKTKLRTHRATRLLLRLAGAAAVLRAGWTCNDHHLPLLLTLCLCAALFSVLDGAAARFTQPTRTQPLPVPSPEA